MRAIGYMRFGGSEVLEVLDLPAPAPAARQVVVRVVAAALNPKDVLVRKGKLRRMSGEHFPRVPGYDFAGYVDRAHPSVPEFRAGDPVYGMVQAWSGGTCAEYVAVPASELARKPVSLGWAEAAGAPLAALTALQALRDLLAVRPRQRVCINGASGGVGTFAVQIARILGASITAVCSARNAELVTELGADEVVDYAVDDPTGPGRSYDAVFDVFGNCPYERARRALVRGGRHCTTVPGPRAVARELAARVRLSRARLVIVKSNREDLATLSGWFDAGKLRCIVDRVVPLSDSVEAHRHLETKRARGKVVVAVDASAVGLAGSSGAPRVDSR